jgi:inner membrane protein
MPTVFTHPAVALAVNPWFRDLRRRPSILAVGAVLTVLPDLDVIGFFYGIPYGHVLGHRGLSHSLPFAFAFSAVIAIGAARLARVKFAPLWLYFGICLASHGLLDACTNGGSGVAFFAPFSDERFFFPVRPIDVSPIGVDAFMTNRGVTVLMSELIWVWSPSAVLLVFAAWARVRPSGGNKNGGASRRFRRMTSILRSF